MEAWSAYKLFTVIGSALAVVLTVLRVSEFVWPGTLDVRLTKEFYFRVLDKGESAFCHASVLVRHGAVVVEDVTLCLRRTSGSLKEYSFAILWVGERRPLDRVVDGQHHFHSRSAVEFIDAPSAKRALFVLVNEEYGGEIESAYGRFHTRSLAILPEVRNEMGTDDPNPPGVQAVERVIEEFQSTVSRALQLEPGTYQLTLKVAYRPFGVLSWWTRTAESRLSFSVGDDFRDRMTSMLRECAVARFRNGLEPNSTPYVTPEYQPLEVREIREGK